MQLKVYKLFWSKSLPLPTELIGVLDRLRETSRRLKNLSASTKLCCSMCTRERRKKRNGALRVWRLSAERFSNQLLRISEVDRISLTDKGIPLLSAERWISEPSIEVVRVGLSS